MTMSFTRVITRIKRPSPLRLKPIKNTKRMVAVKTLYKPDISWKFGCFCLTSATKLKPLYPYLDINTFIKYFIENSYTPLVTQIDGFTQWDIILSKTWFVKITDIEKQQQLNSLLLFITLRNSCTTKNNSITKYWEQNYRDTWGCITLVP